MTKHYYTKGLDIPQDADSVRYPIPEGYTAKIKDGAFILEPKENEEEKIRKEILEYFTITRARDFVANPERQKWISYIEKQKEPTEELSTRLNGLMQEYVKSGKDEEEQEHRLKCYQLFWDAIGDSEFFKQKEQKPDFCHYEVDLSNCSEEYRKAYYDGWNNCNLQHEMIKSEGWGEDDEETLRIITNRLEKFNEWASKQGYTKDVLKQSPEKWLKNLAKRIWKPSEEQMRAFHELLGGKVPRAPELYELYNDLEKLM